MSVVPSQSSHQIDAVLFDADGVIQRAHPDWRSNLEALAPPGREEEFLDDVRTAELGPTRGEGSFPDELAKVLARWNVATPLDEVLDNWLRIDVFTDVQDVVRQIRAAGTQVYLATNQQAMRTAYMRANLDYDQLFDDEFYSCELGLAKPDPAYFTAILDRIGRSGDTVLFLDDNQPNVEGARTAGLHAEHFPPESGATLLRDLLTRYNVPYPS